ncbi:hypothetical protein CDN98_11490 [Roseateles terrae]|nr:hypothetical protein CDN98_11490 [Roseateles terrae]
MECGVTQTLRSSWTYRALVLLLGMAAVPLAAQTGSPGTERMRSTLMAPSTGPGDPASATASGHIRDTMAQRMQPCAMCHGKEGRSTRVGYFPRIAGKPQGYLFNQLQNFRDGRRRNPAMNHLMQFMTDDYLQEIAAYFSSLELPYPPARPNGLTPEQVQVAETLVFRGAPQRQIPACVACHGAKMTGRQPAMPGLLTLPADYLIGQLGAWQTGLRHAKAPDCMADVAKRLTADEVSALANWLSSQAVPADPRPVPAGNEPLPIRCGSGER